MSSNDKGKGSFKGKKIECFNCGVLGHDANDCPSPKDIKKFKQATWSDTNSKESASTISEDARYNPNDLLHLWNLCMIVIGPMIVMMSLLMNK